MIRTVIVLLAILAVFTLLLIAGCIKNGGTGD